MGDEDAYDRVFDGEHRDIVKEAFNAYGQLSKPYLQPCLNPVSRTEVRGCSAGVTGAVSALDLNTC